MTNRPAIKNIIIFVLFLAATVFSYLFLDVSVANWCRKLDKSLLDMIRIVTSIGKSTVYLIVTFFLYLFFRYFRNNKIFANRSLFVFFSVALSGIVVNIIKWISGRYRPVMLFEKGLYGFSFFEMDHELTSFSSGHTVTAFAMALALSILYPKGRVLFFITAVAVAASRVLLSSHYLSDIIFGSYIGIASVQWLNVYFIRTGRYLR